MNTLAPVVVFVYCRLNLTQQLLKTLERNKYVEKTELYIFADIPEKSSLKSHSKEVINYIKCYSNNSKFKKVYVNIAQEHKGLANSVIDGVTSVINKYGKVIVLEDDLLVSEDFLEFMQKALVFYQKNAKIWSITGNTENFPALKSYKHSIYMSYRANSLGWGTWKDRWNKVDWNISDYNNFRYNLVKRYLFNRSGNNMAQMLDRQMLEKNYDSWAIRFCYQQFKEGKWTVYPTSNRVIHIGDDVYATHSHYKSSMPICKKTKFKFENLSINHKLLREMKYAYGPTLKKMMLHKATMLLEHL